MRLPSSSQATTGSSNATNDKDLIKRAEIILAKSMSNKSSISGKSKEELEAVLEELIKKLKRLPPTSMATTTNPYLNNCGNSDASGQDGSGSHSD